MAQDMPDYSEDERILARLVDPVDIEAFSNLMVHAHQKGMSAADFVREEPKRTSRKVIRKLCLKDRKRSWRLQIASVIKTLWDRPAEDPEGAFIHSLYGGPGGRPPQPGENGQYRRR